MRLRDLLKHVDDDTNIKIIEFFDNRVVDTIEDELYSGACYNCPWSIAELYLDTDKYTQAICIMEEKGETYLCVYVREEA